LLSEFSLEQIRREAKRSYQGKSLSTTAQLVREWIAAIDELPKRLATEQRLENAFIKKIMCEGLGHILLGEGPSVSIVPKDRGREGIPDYKVGNFSGRVQYNKCDPAFLLEVKGPLVLNLRASQSSRPDGRSPVEQVVSDMFQEGEQCRFSVVTNMIEFEIISRLFADKRSIVVSLRNIQSDDDIYLLAGLLGAKSSLLNSKKMNLEFKRLEKVSSAITKEFYGQFQLARQELLEVASKHLGDDEVNQFATQLLGQIIFCLYAETIGLIPKDCIGNLLKGTDYSWQSYQKFCRAIDRGSKVNDVNLFGYNGGLFALPKSFKNKYDNSLLKCVEPILEFGFEDREGKVLTHEEIRSIFGSMLEHALEVNEEENLFNFTREGMFADARKKQAQRNEKQKKGTFYTPKFVTKFMTSKVIEFLKNDGINISKSTWLDIACGSGAFLNEVLDQLVEYEANKVGLRKGVMAKNQTARDNILSSLQEGAVARITGYDFDPLAVGLSQLSLSLKCSRPYEKLPSLGKTIIECDSLFDFGVKKYDVIISNPPYMQWRYIPEKYREWLAEDDDYKDFAAQSVDYSAFFFKAAFNQLKPGGILAFIATNKLLATRQSEKFRAWLTDNFDILEILDFRKKIFAKTDVETAIYFLRKKSASKSKVFYKDIHSFVNSGGHLEPLKSTFVPSRIIDDAPYRCIPSRTTPALLKTYQWYKSNKGSFRKLKSFLDIKAGMRVTDIPGEDVLQRSPRSSDNSRYQPLLDGTCLEFGNNQIKDPSRWVASNSSKVSTWKAGIDGKNWYLVVKELSSRPCVSLVSSGCPSVLNSLNLVFPSGLSTVAEGRKIAAWLRSSFSESWMELWFGPNRHHATQRWKDVYVETIPIPINLNSDLVPNWVNKELECFLSGEYREVPDDIESSKKKRG